MRIGLSQNQVLAYFRDIISASGGTWNFQSFKNESVEEVMFDLLEEADETPKTP